MTHTYFGLDVYHNLKKEYQRINNLEYLKLFSQGPDPLMFYHFFLGKKSHYYKNLQHLLHTTNTQDFFINLIHHINTYHLQKDEQVISFLYGFICHYYLDLNVHPYIYYKTGIYNKKDKSTYQYNALHQEMEYMIDIYLIQQKENINPKNFKIHKKIFTYQKFSPSLTKTINDTMNQTYHLKNFCQDYIKSIQYMKHFFHLANYDPTGLKQKIYTIIDSITPSSTINLKELSYHNNYDHKLSYLNLTHQKWHHPGDISNTSTASFFDLYQLSLNEATTTITKIMHMLDKKQLDNQQLKQIFPNLSYVTGYNCNKKIKLKYFEY